MPALNLGTTPITSVQLGSTAINNIYLGTTPVWARATIRDTFQTPGFLQGWINELLGGGVFSDSSGGIFNGSGLIGYLVGFVPGNSLTNSPGTLLADLPTTLEDAYCGAVGAVGGLGGGNIPDGLLGLINGNPITLGGGLTSLGDLIKQLLSGGSPLTAIESIIGQVPVLGTLGQLIGVSPDSTGALADPLNFIVDEAGQVLGVLTCGQYQPHTGSDQDVWFVIGSTGQMARMLIPDGLVSLGDQTSRFRHPTTTAGDDGYLETQIANLGSPGFVTQVFRRYANSGGASGVGLDFRNSQVSIVRRVSSADTLMAPNLAAVSNGDVFRLVQAGNVHTLYRNGDTAIGSWNDSGATAAKGSGNRSVAMMMQAAQQFLGTRRFSPSLAYVEAA